MTGKIYNPSGIWLRTTTPVGSYAANPWGLYDMIGNVGEWCQDWYGRCPVGPVTDPPEPVTGSDRVIRGYHHDALAMYCRSARRNSFPPSYADGDNGFRVVLAPGQ